MRRGGGPGGAGGAGGAGEAGGAGRAGAWLGIVTSPCLHAARRRWLSRSLDVQLERQPAPASKRAHLASRGWARMHFTDGQALPPPPAAACAIEMPSSTPMAAAEAVRMADASSVDLESVAWRRGVGVSPTLD